MFAIDMDLGRIVESIACASRSMSHSRQNAAPTDYVLLSWERHPAAKFYSGND
jgi:hypothetical protein